MRNPRPAAERFLGEVQSFDPTTGTVTIAIDQARPGDVIALHRGARIGVDTDPHAGWLDYNDEEDDEQ